MQISDNGLDNELNRFESKRILKLKAKKMVHTDWAKMFKVLPRAFACFLGKSWLLFQMHRSSVTSGLYTEMTKLNYTI